MNPAKRTLKRIFRKPLKPVLYAYRRRRDLALSELPTHSELESRLGTSGIIDSLNFPKNWSGGTTDLFGLSTPNPEQISGTLRSANNSISGLIDVLGSGPVNAGVNFKAAGAFGHKYERPSLKQEFQHRQREMLGELHSARDFLDDTSDQTTDLIKNLSQSEYEPVDWQIDIKSGYRWDPTGWWLDQKIGPAPGADIKVPWEISRSHYLVDIAIASNLKSQAVTSDIIGLRILDWITANPAWRGVNWRSTMEVAIRATNWIWALAISEMGTPTSPSIIWLVTRSLEQHAKFIMQYPDAGGRGASNHYIADIAGLAHIAAAIPTHESASKWAQIAAKGLAEQVQLAVNEDGFSFEGSVGYHRLITEMLTHGTLATMRFPATWTASQAIDHPKHWQKLTRMFMAANTLRKPNGRSPQFGDHDAGRFLKFHTPLTAEGKETSIDHSHLNFLIDGIIGNSPDSPTSTNAESILPTIGLSTSSMKIAQNSIKATHDQPIKLNNAWLAESDRFWVAVQTFNAQPLSPTGHLHDDALTLELCIDGQEILVDPGSGVYTGDLEARFRLRKRMQHSTAGPQHSPKEASDPFVLDRLGSVTVERSEQHAFAATYNEKKWTLHRTVNVNDSEVEIIDTFEGKSPWEQVFIFHPDVSVSKAELSGDVVVIISSQKDKEITLQLGHDVASVDINEAEYSPNYGTLVPTKRLIIKHAKAGTNTIKFGLA